MDKTIKIVSLYKRDVDKLKIFASVYGFICDINSSDISYPDKLKYIKLLNECLRITIQSFNKIDYVDYRVLLRSFVKILKGNPLSKIVEIREIIAKYEESVNSITWLLPYVDMINRLDECFYIKTYKVMIMWNYLEEVLESLDYYGVNDNIKVQLVYELSDVFNGDTGDLKSTLELKCFNILKRLYANSEFDLSGVYRGMEEFINDLSLEERDLWLIYQISIICHMDDITRVIDKRDAILVFNKIKAKLLEYAVNKDNKCKGIQ